MIHGYRSTSSRRRTRWVGRAIVALAAGLASAWGQNGPHLGYVYPAGGRQGTVVRVTVGGQLLRDPQAVYVSGPGVSAEVVQYVRPLTDQERGRTEAFLRDIVRRRWSLAALGAAHRPPGEMPPLPDHPWLQDLDEQSPEQIARLRERLFNPKAQPNAQLAEQVDLKITIDPGAPPGDRELRLLTATGLTNPLRFQVSGLPEVRAEEVGASGEALAAPVDLPAELNGQILPGETDRFRLRARQGQQLVIRVEARRLMPYLADAVPGWFQAAATLYDPQGKRVAFADHYRFDPDPVLLYAVPADGVYGLEVRDSIYRGREDFVYRVSVGELPFITSLFPLGGAQGTPTTAALTGWNLPAATLVLDTGPAGGSRREAAVGLSNAVPYAVDTLPESAETEPNDTPEHAQPVTLPRILNGRISRPGDVDVFRLDGQAGQEIVAQVWARRLGSPLDGALRLVDATGAEVAANDDHDDPESGLLTHQADPYLDVKLPKDGAYLLYLSDAQHQGGEEYAYRLELRPAQPDFALRVVPASLSLVARGAATATVRAIRKEGFAGDIDLTLADAPPGFKLGAAKIAAGQDSAQVTLSVPRDAASQVAPVRLEGHAQIGGAAVTRPVVPAEDLMQAFAYMQLVPRQALLVAVTGSRPVPAIWRPLVAGMTLAGDAALQIPQGGTAEVAVGAPPTLPDPRQTPLAAVHFVLSNSPRGVRLQSARLAPGGVALTCKADANSTLSGQAGNLIVEAYVEIPQASGGTQRVSLGVLPAIPYAVGPGS